MSSIVKSAFDQLKRNEKVHVFYCAGGIILSLLLYGVLQEKLLQWPYDGEIFKSSTLFIVLCNRVVSFLVAVLMLLYTGETIAPAAPLHKYAMVSVSNVVATSCQYEALRHISFPLQTLGKCSKMIPVMIWGSCIMRKSYKFLDYGVAVVVTLGCTMFFLTGSTVAKQHEKAGNDKAFTEAIYGILLMAGYLGFDGFTSTFQDKLFKGYNMSTYNQIMYITMWSSTLSLGSLVIMQQLTSALGFVTRHPEAFYNIMTLSAAATVAQLFISHTIKTFGALLFATVMTVRQVISIVLSCILFNHPLTYLQWISVGCVFGALYYKSYAKEQEKRAARKVAPPPDEKIVVEFDNPIKGANDDKH